MSSGFVSERDLEEARRLRQEEWNRVRSADQPKEAPEPEEAPYDHRSLFERLQEQKQKKDLEYEEAHKLKNMIKGLDDDEIEYLDLVDRTKLAVEHKNQLEEERELMEYRERVASLQEKSLDNRLQVEMESVKVKNTNGANNKKHSQQKLLKGVVVKKNEVKKRKLEDESPVRNERDQCADENNIEPTSNKRKLDEPSESEKLLSDNRQEGALTCIGILPGVGCYGNSSDSDEMSSDSDQEVRTSGQNVRIDMLGRKLVEKTKNE